MAEFNYLTGKYDETPQGYDWQKSVFGLGDQGGNSGSGPTVPTQGMEWNNPYKFTPWGVGAEAGAGFGGKFGTFLGANAPLIGAGFDMLKGGVGAYSALKQLGIAEDALSLEKKRFKTNLANQVKSYNTQMGDRIAGRSYATEAERVAALSAAQLPDPTQKKKGG